MLRKKITLLVCFHLLYSATFMYAETSNPHPTIRNPQIAPPIRAAYFHLKSSDQGKEHLQQLSTYGFNTALVADGSYRLREDLWRLWGPLADQYTIALIPVIHAAVPQEFRRDQDSYRPYVDRNGEIYQATPCPIDETYWNTVIGERFARLAELATTTPIAGITFDSELYGSNISYYADLCYCDICWQEFTHSDPLFDPEKAGIHQGARHLRKEKRFDYLERHHLLRRYTLDRWNRARTIFSQIEQRVHRIHPQLRLGIVMYAHTWFYHALVQGLGRPENPMLVFSESSYVRGYTPYVDQEQDHVVGNQHIARYVPGLWLSRFFPQDLPSQLTDLTAHTDGYWVYTADSLWAKVPRSENNALHASPSEYWTALKHTNNELSHLSDNSGSSERMVPPVQQSSFYDSSERQLLRTPALKRVLTQVMPVFPPPLSPPTKGGGSNEIPPPRWGRLGGGEKYPPDPIIYRGQTLVHCLTSSTGSFQLTHVPLGKDTDPESLKLSGNQTSPIEYILFDHGGHVIQESQVRPPESPKVVEVSTDTGKMVSLLVTSGLNGAHITTSGLACMLEASSTFPLETFFNSPPLEEPGGEVSSLPSLEWKLYVPPEQQRLKFRAHCPPQEAAFITVRSPEQLFSQSIRITGFTEFHVDKRASDTQAFQTIITAPDPSSSFGDLRFYLYDAEFPYLIFP